MTLEHFRISHAGAVFNPHHKKRAASCGSNFYKAPSMGQSVDSLQPLTVGWDSSCIDAKLVDIYLLAPGSDEYPRMHIWQNVPNADGVYNAQLMPRWWNSTESMLLQIGIIDAGKPLFLTQFPAGPSFTATYTPPATGVPDAADTSKANLNDGVTNVSVAVGAASSSHLSKGKIAAAVIIPLLVAIAAIYGYLRWSRTKGKEKRKAWTEKIDKRMSTISTEWKSMSAAGANAAIRNSIAVGENGAENRLSSFSFGAIRPSADRARSVYGEGASAGAQMSQISINTQVSHIRPGLRQSAFENRVSRVSFAADTRPSGESRRTRNIPSEYIPPVPAVSKDVRANSTYRPQSNFADNGEADAYDVGSMSPRQTIGAPALSPDDISSRLGGGDDIKGRPSFGFDVLPALSLMRTGLENDIDEPSYMFSPPSEPLPTHAKSAASPSTSSAGAMSPDYYNGAPANPAQYVNAPPSATLFSSSPLSPGYPIPASPPSAASPSSSSPFSSNFTGMQSFGGMMQQAIPASMMSPDDMLKAYAARSATPAAGNRMSSYLGTGTGFGATVTTSTSAPPEGKRRSLVPASPGAYSASRGAYGVTYDEAEEWGSAH